MTSDTLLESSSTVVDVFKSILQLDPTVIVPLVESKVGKR
jgi:hypothetical protein